MAETQNYGLYLSDNETESFRSAWGKVAGTQDSNMIKIDAALSGKADSSHGEHVPAPQTADNKKFLRNDNSWQDVTPENIGAADKNHQHSKDDITDFSHTHNASEISAGLLDVDRIPILPAGKIEQAVSDITVNKTRDCTYYKTLDNIVHVYVQDMIYEGGVIGTLPVGYRPSRELYFPCILMDNNSSPAVDYIARLRIDTNGEITLRANRSIGDVTQGYWYVLGGTICFLAGQTYSV